MSVYVDDVFIRTEPGHFGMRFGATWCHMTADTKQELHDFAAQLGLKREWYQDQDSGHWHYDVTKTVRARAIRAGAIPIGHTLADFARVWHRPGREGVQ